MSESKAVELEVMLDYLAGTCEPATEAYISQQLKDPDSQESHALRELDALTEYCEDGKGLEGATREALTSWLGEVEKIFTPAAASIGPPSLPVDTHLAIAGTDFLAPTQRPEPGQVGEDKETSFLAMELLEGEPLDECLKREKKLSLREAIRIAREIAEGLEVAHTHGLIHGDIKPGNIWLEDPGRRVKILDFAPTRMPLTQSGRRVGIPPYMAPEQALDKLVDARCDVFGLGCILYRLCTGKLPFKGNDTMSILSEMATETPTPPSKVDATVPQALSDLILNLLAKQREGRPASANDVVNALREMEKEDDSTEMTPSHVERNDRVREIGIFSALDPYELAITEENRRIIANELFKMNGEDRRAIWLRYVKGLTDSQIAETLGCSLSAVKTVLGARKLLRAALKGIKFAETQNKPNTRES